ncbi:MAG: tripartite tricarboxylate transporter permease [Armatimonadota bacterium]|nr:tripartite tricarboxylate transporter permease [Armatimonadota bacterium]MDR7519145.1 tripartite tricarboxylate transporter permease [Armatimonadota bacterium]MDR7549605.1 tripartite tricarboxylate transporter permease [Armatimonadota bacterium]
MSGPWLDAVAAVLSPHILVPLAVGVAAGLIGGAIPGITITLTVILVLPFTFGMDPLQGLATMIGVYVGGESGGLVTASLLGIPGTPSAIATTFDGYPMARRGEPGRAVWLGIWAGVLGGLLAGVPLVAGALTLARLALSFGPWEYFSLFVLTLSIVSGLSEQSLLKGLISATVGLLATVIGSDPMMGVARFTFGAEALRSGFPFLAVLIGVYAFAQLMGELERQARGGVAARPADLSVSHLQVLREILGQWGNLVRSTLIGLWIGVLPAVGGSAANVLAYDQAKKASRTPERFGTGIPDGIVASESANNANIAGSLVTMMAFGIPGDAVTAVMLGALIIHGIAPGPTFIASRPHLAYGIFAAYFTATVLTVLVEAGLLRLLLRVVRAPLHLLVPIILVLAAVGTYALNNLMANVWVLFAFGIVGYLMVKTGFPLAPLVLGVILGDQIEVNLIRAMMTEPNPLLFVARPLSGLMLALAVGSFVLGVSQQRRRARVRTAPDAAAAPTAGGR